MPKAAAPLDQRIRILFLASNPVTMSALRLAQEVRQIEEKLNASKHRDAIDLVAKWAVRPDDLQQALLDVEPSIVHFSGHGSDKEGLYFESPEGISAPVDKESLVELLGILKGGIRLVMLNACQTQTLAEAITSTIDCAIGTRLDIGDEAAVEFSAAFYRAIGSGQSIKVAFDLGRNALRLKQIPEDRTPELHVRAGVDPGEIILGKVPGKTRGLLLDLRWSSLRVKLSVAFVLVTCCVIAAVLWVRGSRSPEIDAFLPTSEGIMLRGSWMGSAGGKALCEALQNVVGRESVRCVPFAPREPHDPMLHVEARAAGAAVLALVGEDGQAQLFPLGLLEHDPVAGGEFSLDISRAENRSRTVTLLRALARLAKRGQGFTSEEVPCPSINVGPLDRLTLLSQLIVPSCYRVAVDLPKLREVCDAPGSNADDCGLAMSIYVERCPTCPDARARLTWLRDKAPARFRAVATLKLARMDCEAGEIEEAAGALKALRGSECLKVAFSEVAACITHSPSQSLCEEPPCPPELSRIQDDPAVRAMEQAEIAHHEECSPALRSKVLGGRAFYRARGADLAGAEADYGSAFTLSHEPLYELSRIEILLRQKKTEESQKALGALASVKLDDARDQTYAALLRWIASREGGSPTVKLDAAALRDLYRTLPLSETALRDPDDKDLRALACPMPTGSACAFDVLVNSKTSASEDELAKALGIDH